MTPGVGVVIPTRNEAEHLPRLLEDLAAVPEVVDIVVADAGSSDATVAVATAAGARVIRSEAGRGPQLRAGAAAVRGDWLCFLHADIRLPPPARRDLSHCVRDATCQAAVWRLAIEAPGRWFRVIEWGAGVRDRIGGLPYGDQGLLLRRAAYDAVGGYPALPIMEDVALARAVAREVELRRLQSAVRVSARRWQREGPVRAWCRNVLLLGAYLAGVSPDTLVRWYRPEAAARTSGDAGHAAPAGSAPDSK